MMKPKTTRITALRRRRVRQLVIGGAAVGTYAVVGADAVLARIAVNHNETLVSG